MSSTTYPSVPAGPYFGFTRAEMGQELARYKAELKARQGLGIISASVNGKAFSYGPQGGWTLEQWQSEIALALALVDPDHTRSGASSAIFSAT